MNDDTGITPEQGVLRDLMLSGGGTYRGDTLAAFRPTDGYAVGIGGVARRIDGDTPLGADELGLLLRDLAEAYSTTYVGTWLQGNVAYLDAVLIHWDVEQALRTAAYHGQDSIYDFAAGESIKVFAQQWDS